MYSFPRQPRFTIVFFALLGIALSYTRCAKNQETRAEDTTKPNQKHTARLQQVQKAVKDLKQQKDRLEDEINTKTQTITDLEAAMQTAGGEKTTLAQQLQEAQEALEDLEQEKSTVDADLSNREGEIQTLRREKQEAIQRLEEQLKDAEAQLQHSESVLKGVNAQLINARVRAKQEADKYWQAVLQEKEQRLKDAELSRSIFQKSNEKLEELLRKEQVSRQRDGVNTQGLEKQNQEAQERIQTLEQDVNKARENTRQVWRLLKRSQRREISSYRDKTRKMRHNPDYSQIAVEWLKDKLQVPDAQLNPTAPSQDPRSFEREMQILEAWLTNFRAASESLQNSPNPTEGQDSLDPDTLQKANAALLVELEQPDVSRLKEWMDTHNEHVMKQLHYLFQQHHASNPKVKNCVRAAHAFWQLGQHQKVFITKAIECLQEAWQAVAAVQPVEGGGEEEVKKKGEEEVKPHG